VAAEEGARRRVPIMGNWTAVLKLGNARDDSPVLDA
jgi:hypothetical protein